MLAIATGTAHAARLPLQTFGANAQPTFVSPASIAVDQSTGDVLVADMQAQTLSRFKADGEPAPFSALGGSNVIDGASGADETPQGEILNNFGSPNEVQVAVDNSGGPTEGNIYVTNLEWKVVDIFASTGEFIGELSEWSGGELGETCGVAVGPDGDVYVADYENGIQKYVPTGSVPTNGDNTATFDEVETVCNIAAGSGPSAGYLFAAAYEGELFKVDASTGESLYELSSESPIVSVDPATGFVLAANKGAKEIQIFDASGASAPDAPTETVALPSIPTGVATHGAEGTLYVARAGASHLEYTLAASPPVVTVGPAEAETATLTARLHGSVNPLGNTVEGCEFEWGGGEQQLTETQACAETPDEIGSGTAPVPVETILNGLEAGVTYHYRLSVRAAGTAYRSAVRSLRLSGESPSSGASGGCPNEAMRVGPSASLPDCRAYEQASPSDKSGANMTGRTNLVQAAAAGDAVTSFSQASIPGGVGAQEFPSFLSVRNGESWSTRGLFPPPSYGDEISILGSTSDLAYTFEEATRYGGGRALLMRESATGSIIEIVPYLQIAEAAYSFVGASPDATRVFFEVVGPSLASGAAAGHGNLYVWSRDSGVVSLAGALNTGQAPAEGTVGGPYNWFEGRTEDGGARQTAGGGYYTQDENAISGDGASVYFTAVGSGVLYERLNPTAPQSPLDSQGECSVPGDACTIEVQASEKTNGSGAGGRDAAGTRPSAFMQASTNGDVAFFTSSEKLTNDATTGPEPEPPAIARAGIAGGGKELGFLPADAKGLAVDGSYIYWADPAAGAIGRARLDGSGVDERFITGIGDPQYVAVDPGHVYWTNTGDGTDGGGSIGRAALDGSAIEPDFIPGTAGGQDIVNGPTGIAVDSSHVYWGNIGESRATSHIERANLNGTDPEWFGVNGAGNPTSWEAQGLALSGGYLYMTFNSRSGALEGCVERIEIAQPIHFSGFACASGRRYGGLAAEGSHLYWAVPEGNSIARSGMAGEEFTPGFIQGAASPQGVAANGVNIFWSANQSVEPNSGNDLYRFDAGAPVGTRLTDLTVDHEASDLNGAEVQGVLGTSADGSYVYFAANGVLAPGASRGDCSGHAGAGFFGTVGTCSLYVWHAGQTQFIARLDTAGQVNVSDAADWQPLRQTRPQEEEATARVSEDGRVLLFRSQRRLTGYDNERQPEFYRYDAASGSLDCVSCDPSGAAPKGAATLQSNLTFGSVPRQPGVLTRNLSAGGNRVFFQTPDQLLASDTNAATDVYEWEADGTGSCESSSQNGGCLYLLSSGRGDRPSYFADASPSGDDAFVFTADQLVVQDRDQLVDIYDARVDGGLASQNEIGPTPCGSEGACRAEAGAQQASTGSATSGFVGPGNQKAKGGATCRRYASKAGQLSSQASRLRRNAKSAAHHGKPGKAKSMRRKANQLAGQAKKESDKARQCRKGSGGPK